ncbi:DUF302 domain-containing protein [Sphingopyxis sp. DHUNG17]|uniref:DUF302 domain-containing protein n=1 Tax=Sphingopyxis jiangsuensis TaxID=2871171 RepID=UPI00191E347C|nr:DUF302 domain-containing protein [Sphingopyxis lutea]MBL0767622.1 DUF302 domain-containing protein [Sphingopyxis lutea]
MNRTKRIASALAAALVLSIVSSAQAEDVPVRAATATDVLTLSSANGFDDTVAKLAADVADKGIRHFATIDQAALARGADLPLRRSTLVIFGNPPLGVQFLQSNPLSGLDWPVRMLVTEDAAGNVKVAWTDFGAIARRYDITDRAAQFAMASEVAASIATAATR